MADRPSPRDPLLICRIGPYALGIPIVVITEILDHLAIQPLPHVPDTLAGVAVVRGQPLSVWTLGPLLRTPKEPIRLTLRWEWNQHAVLLAVDRVDSLWQPGEAIASERWEGVVPTVLRPWIAEAFRHGEEWLWALPPDVPERLQDGILDRDRPGTMPHSPVLERSEGS